MATSEHAIPISVCLLCDQEVLHWRFHVSEHRDVLGDDWEQEYVLRFRHDGKEPLNVRWDPKVACFRDRTRSSYVVANPWPKHPCLECGIAFKATSWVNHMERDHPGLSILDYIIRWQYGGVRPLCACGCGGLTTFMTGSPVSSLIRRFIVTHQWRIPSKTRKIMREVRSDGFALTLEQTAVVAEKVKTNAYRVRATQHLPKYRLKAKS